MALVKSWVEISGTRLVENLRVVQTAAGVGAETLAVVKANGYGHDAELVARVLVDAGVRWLGVSDVEEGARMRAAVGEEARILVMCGMEAADCKEIIANRLTPVVWTVDHIAMIEEAAKTAGLRARVHLEIDTGMARQGADLAGLAEVTERLAESRWVACEGVMSHLSSSEIEGSEVTERQRKRFAVALNAIVAKGVKPELVHLENTSAVDEGASMEWVRDAAAQLGARPMIRTGLALYGHCLPIETRMQNTGKQGVLAPQLQPVLTWKARVIGVQEIQVGDTVGYGATFCAKAPMKLALVPVGYADGFRRESSSGMGNGWVMILGRRAPVVGRVSMNLITVDVSEIAGVGVGDEVVLLGEGVSAEDHARWSKTIAYDILCGIRAKFSLT